MADIRKIALMLSAPPEVMALAARPGVVVFTVFVAPVDATGRSQTCVYMEEETAAVLPAALAMLGEVSALCRRRADVAGSDQIAARAERCRDILSAELAP